MLIIRDVFTARPGKASALAKLFLDVTKDGKHKTRVLTDFVSTHNTVILEMEFEGIEALPALLQERKPWAARMRDAGYGEMFYTGRREILQVAGESD